MLANLQVELPRTLEAAWAAALKLDAAGPWAVTDVASASEADHSSLLRYTAALVSNGYAEVVGERPSRSPVVPGVVTLHRLLRRPPAAPRFGRDGRLLKTTGQQQMWNAMRALASFTALELAMSASTDEVAVSPAAAKDYVRRLITAGYLKVIRPARGGTPAQVRLLPSRNTGPSAPQIMRTKFVWDPNIKKVAGASSPAEEVRS
ncbi:hypothetical protein [Aquabacter cavernae]|uniref:hypothetical protein n=1 Tax=Aquabacter cavernae TaxID=2496029 RepID=UPI000F8DC099|nr:hypothetical protein [Aquabacter cavernae]